MVEPFLGVPPTIKSFRTVGLIDLVWTIVLFAMNESYLVKEMVRLRYMNKKL